MRPSVKLEFGFGIGLDRDGNRIAPEDAAAKLEVIQGFALARFGGFTLVKTEGGWRSPIGHDYVEEGRTLIVYSSEPNCEDILAMASHIKNQLNQEAVFLSSTHVLTMTL